MTIAHPPVPPVRVLIADDHPVVRDGLTLILAQEPGLELAGVASTGREALELFRQQRPDVTVVDLSLPDLSGLDVIATACRESPGARFVVFSVHGGEDDVYRALRAGALGYLRKDAPAEEIVAAIRSVSRGRRYLAAGAAGRLADRVNADEFTGRELDVLQQLAGGLSNKEIATGLGIGEGTVKTHVSNVLGKLGVRTRSQAILAALRRGLVRGEPAE